VRALDGALEPSGKFVLVQCGHWFVCVLLRFITFFVVHLY